MFCGRPVAAEGLDPCQVVVTNGWARPREDQAYQEFFAHAACLREAVHPSLVEDAYVLDPQLDAGDAPDGYDDASEDLAPVTMTWRAVRQWLGDLPVDTSWFADRVAWSPVFSSQPFAGGRAELDRTWGPGSTTSWLGGPALPGGSWPRRADGAALAHVMTVSLAGVDEVFEDKDKRAWPDSRQGLPRTGYMEVFHDLETYGGEAEDRDLGAWLVRWVPEPVEGQLQDPPDDLSTPSEVCQAGIFFPGWSIPSSSDVPADDDSGRFELAEHLTEQVQRAWTYQRTGSTRAHPVPVTHVYGHSQSGTEEALGILRRVLPRTPDDDYRLVLEIESWTHLDGWFGDVGSLEVWMRESDLTAGRFEDAWCLVRTG